MFSTIRYKNAVIHESYNNGYIIEVQFLDNYDSIRVRSVHAAKLLITKTLKNI